MFEYKHCLESHFKASYTSNANTRSIHRSELSIKVKKTFREGTQVLKNLIARNNDNAYTQRKISKQILWTVLKQIQVTSKLSSEHP